jgi:hypothetical protein
VAITKLESWLEELLARDCLPEEFDTPLIHLTEKLLRKRQDIESIAPADPSSDQGCLGCWGGPDYFDDECIYDPCDDATARWLLEDFLYGRSQVDGHISGELSKLLSKRPYAIADMMAHLIDRLDHRPSDSIYSYHNLAWSYFANRADGETRALQLLDLVPEDCRDGLFLACYKLNTPAIYEKMKRKVREWYADYKFWGSGTGERGRVAQMVKKWDKTFPNGDHEDIRRICRRRR